MPEYQFQSNAGSAIQKYLLDQAARDRQAQIDAQVLAHQQEQERLAREQEQRMAETATQAQRVQNEQLKIQQAAADRAAQTYEQGQHQIGEELTPDMTRNLPPSTVQPGNPAIAGVPGIIAAAPTRVNVGGTDIQFPGAEGRAATPSSPATPTTYKGNEKQQAMNELMKNERITPEIRQMIRAGVIDDAALARLLTPTSPKPPTAEEDKAKAIDIGTRLSMGQPVSEQEKAWANNYERVSTQGTRTSFNLNTPVRDTARSDRSYAALSGQLESGYKPVNDQLDRMGRLVISVNQETPQADALIAPELLTAMAGGMGSGLRMNESEIARIVGGRSAFENLKATIMHYNPDNNQALSVTPAQRQQIRALIAAMQEKLFAKQEAYTKARQDLAAADSVDEQRQVHNTLKESLGNIDNPPQKGTAGTSGASAAPTNETPAARAKRLYDQLTVK